MAEQGKPQSSKSKKSKREHHAADTAAAEASAGGPVVAAREDKRKRKEERSVVRQERSRTETAVTSKHKCEEGTAGGTEENGNAARSKKNRGSKRVSFADSAEVFRTRTEGGDGEEGGGGNGESRLVHGRRFTPEEDATLMEAITSYTEMKQLGEKGLEMIRSPRQHPELRRCWEVIGKSLPHRPHTAIYRRARILLNRSDVRKWTQDEKDHIRRFVEKNGTEWKTLAHELGKCDIHVKDTWRRIKVKNLKKGRWTQDEHQKLFDLVNIDLRLKAHQIKNPDHRKLRDNISWEAISEKLTTRNHKNCCLKWYDTLASPLVKKGIWADIDDYLLVEARLQKDDAVCIEDVDWDSLLDHRSGEVCRQRWNQMVRGIGGHREKPFIQQVEVLSRRYCPEMIEYRK